MQIVSSLVPYYKKEELINQEIIVLVNLRPTRLSGELSQSQMILKNAPLFCCKSTDTNKSEVGSTSKVEPTYIILSIVGILSNNIHTNNMEPHNLFLPSLLFA